MQEVASVSNNLLHTCYTEKRSEVTAISVAILWMYHPNTFIIRFFTKLTVKLNLHLLHTGLGL